jgi:hypothetical protein
LGKDVDDIITQMTSIDILITGLMFKGRKPKHYKSEETIRKMCPPNVRQIFYLENLKRLGVVYTVPKMAHLVALEGLGIRVAKRLYETGEVKRVCELYGVQNIP